MTPNTTVTLYATPFDISNKYVIAVDSQAEALGVLSSYPSKVYTDCYWQRDNDFVFRANGNINEVEQYNYCVYLNNGRYNFAFITQCDYVNDAMTLVHLALDPWLNFAGQYVFHDSPMVRCHPDAGSTAKVNYHTEPYTVEAWRTTSEPFGTPATEGTPTYGIFLVTTLNADQYSNTTLQVWLQGLYELLNGGGAATIQQFYEGLDADTVRIIGGHLQAPTYYAANYPTLKTILEGIARNSRSGDIVGAYYIPPSLRPVQAMASGQIDVMTPKTDSIILNVEPPETIHWKKIRYSEQFNRLYVNLCGNINYIPFNNLKQDISTIELHIYADPSINGCIYAYVDDVAMYNAEAYMFHSMPWDRVQVSAYGIDSTAMVSSVLSLAPTLFDSVKNIAGSAWGIVGDTALGALTGGIGGAVVGLGKGIAGTAVEVARGVANVAPELLNQGEIIRSGGFARGTGVSSMASYNQHFPLVTFAIERPYDISNLEEFFGTYGYMQNGDIYPIVFKQLPHWHYYQTANASIEGHNVPQRYLAQVIGMFNSGVFVFNSAADYKDFSKAQSNHY